MAKPDSDQVRLLAVERADGTMQMLPLGSVGLGGRERRVLHDRELFSGGDARISIGG